MKIGYIRVSREEQSFDLQIDALNKIGCERIYKEKISGASKTRPEFNRMMEQLRSGDTVVVWRVDRLGRTTLELISLMVTFSELGVNFVSVTEGIDTSTKMGKLWYMLSSVFAENEREVIRERTKSGLAAARARGRVGGRPKGLSKEAMSKALAIKSLYDQQEKTMKEIAADFGLSRSTCYRYLEVAKQIKGKQNQ